jgi:site-specific DNA recombinase
MKEMENRTEISIKEPVALYGRVSTRVQKNNETIKNQKIALDNYAREQNLFVYCSYYDDGISGDLPFDQRPGGSQLLKDAENKKFKKVIILKGDRFGRDTIDSLYTRKKLEQCGVALCGVLENVDDDFMFTIYQAVSQKEKKDILLRSRLGRERAIGEGRWVDGFPPYGYEVNPETKKLKIFEDEAPIIKKIYDLCVINKLSCPKIAEVLNREEIPPYTEGKNKKIYRENVRGKTVINAKFWYSARVLTIIKDPIYKGIKEIGRKSKDKKIIKILNVDPVVSEEIWEKAQKVLRSNIIEATRNKKRNYILRGLISCGVCNRNYSGLKSHQYLFYGCNGYRLINNNSPEKCFNKNIKADVLEDTVWGDVKDFIKNPQQIKKFLLENHRKLSKVNFNIEMASEQDNHKKIEKEISNLIDLGVSEGGTSKKILEKKLNKLDKQAEESKDRLKQLERLQQESSNQEKQMNKIQEKLEEFNTFIDEPTAVQKEKLIKLVVDKIIVYPREDKNDRRSVEIIYKFNKDKCSIAVQDPTG